MSVWEIFLIMLCMLGMLLIHDLLVRAMGLKAIKLASAKRSHDVVRGVDD